MRGAFFMACSAGQVVFWQKTLSFPAPCEPLKGLLYYKRMTKKSPDIFV